MTGVKRGSLVSALIIGLLLVSLSAVAQNSTPFTSKELSNRTVYRRAVDAVIWGLPELRKNPDGSVDIYVGPKPPAGQESNWLYTPVGEKWFPWFRVYGPEKAILDKSWKLPDIERISH